MEIILQEVAHALKSNLYYLAIMTTLSLPDICAAIESPNGKASKEKYIKWCDENIDCKPLTSTDLYSLRCGVLHQSVFEHPKMGFNRVLFTVPNPNNITFHNNIVNDALNLDVVIFCEGIMKAVINWYEVKKETPNIVKNMPRVIQYRANGFPPYIVGVPVVG